MFDLLETISDPGELHDVLLSTPKEHALWRTLSALLVEVFNGEEEAAVLLVQRLLDQIEITSDDIYQEVAKMWDQAS